MQRRRRRRHRRSGTSSMSIPHRRMPTSPICSRTLGNPDAITLEQLLVKATGAAAEWLLDRKNRRSIPHRLDRCGYTSVRNPETSDGRWKVQGKRRGRLCQGQPELARPDGSSESAIGMMLPACFQRGQSDSTAGLGGHGGREIALTRIGLLTLARAIYWRRFNYLMKKICKCKTTTTVTNAARPSFICPCSAPPPLIEESDGRNVRVNSVEQRKPGMRRLRVLNRHAFPSARPPCGRFEDGYRIMRCRNA